MAKQKSEFERFVQLIKQKPEVMDLMMHLPEEEQHRVMKKMFHHLVCEMKRNESTKVDAISVVTRIPSGTSAEDIVADALAKGKVARETREVIEPNENVGFSNYLPRWVNIVLISIGVLELTRELFSHSGLISILLLLITSSSAIVYVLKRKIGISNRNAYYWRNGMTAIGICLGFLILANHDQILRQYCSVFMDGPRFSYTDEVDDYGRPMRELDVDSNSGFSFVPLIIKWGIMGVAVGLPYLTWRLTDLSFEYWKKTNESKLCSLKKD